MENAHHNSPEPTVTKDIQYTISLYKTDKIRKSSHLYIEIVADLYFWFLINKPTNQQNVCWTKKSWNWRNFSYVCNNKESMIILNDDANFSSFPGSIITSECLWNPLWEPLSLRYYWCVRYEWPPEMGLFHFIFGRVKKCVSYRKLCTLRPLMLAGGCPLTDSSLSDCLPQRNTYIDILTTISIFQ